jgi:hypothetical protein
VKTLDRRLRQLEGKVPPPSRDAALDEFGRAFEGMIGASLADLVLEELDRLQQMLREVPGCPASLLRACLARTEDREPERPDGQWCRVNAQGQRQWFTPDTPEWRTHSTWQRRRWGYLTAKDDPEAMALAQRVAAWAASPDRAYLRGADLRLLLVRLGVDLAETGFLELRRLVDLCAALDELALAEPTFEAPMECWWAVLGWSEGHAKRPWRAA